MSESPWVHLDFDLIVAESQKAFQIEFANGRTLWVPMSVIADHEDYGRGNTNGSISVQEWWAKKEGMSND